MSDRPPTYDRRRANDEQMGYLTGKMEEFGDILKSHLESDAKHLEGIAAKLDKLEDKVTEKFTTVETIIKVIKLIFLGLAAVLTFKFGDIATIYHSLFP